VSDTQAIDNTPLAVAKEEGEAQEAARRAPLAHYTVDTFSSNLYEFAKRSGKLVFNELEDAGISKDEIATMRNRMVDWVNIVGKYAKDIRDAWKLDMDDGDRRRLVDDMLATREEVRVNLFGR